MTKVFDFLIICFYAALGYLIWDKIGGAVSEKIFLELRDIRKNMK